MSCFSSISNGTSTAAPDPAKHVNYNVGMVLGVDDFNQEFAYLSGRDQWMGRDLLGYGTVRGLRVRTELDAEKGPRVVVEPGVAVSPSGQMICVPTAQCAYLRSFVADHEGEIPTPPGSPVASVPLYVVLCYRDCKVDNVPIAGEPCRSDDQLTAFSRIKDDFCLELRTKRPHQREEDAIRDFVVWLRQIPVEEFGTSTPLDQFLNAIRDAASAWFTSPPSTPLTSPPMDYMFGSPPGFLQMQTTDLCKYTDAAFRLWVTELRPKWIERWHGCAPAHFESDPLADEDCVLLGELSVPVQPKSPGPWNVPDAQVSVNDTTRPYLVHMRMLQEWLICGVRPPAANEVAVRNVVGPATINLTGADELVACDPSSGAIQVNLPPAVNYPGRVVIVKLIMDGSVGVTIVPANSDLIDGQAKLTMKKQFTFVQLASGSKGGWHIIASS